MCLLWGRNWVFISQKTASFIIYCFGEQVKEDKTSVTSSTHWSGKKHIQKLSRKPEKYTIWKI
jgi:hypothetical protein